MDFIYCPIFVNHSFSVLLFCLSKFFVLASFFFFFQAEDGIRDDLVTGVQTCALPISAWFARWRARPCRRRTEPRQCALSHRSRRDPALHLCRRLLLRRRGRVGTQCCTGTDLRRRRTADEPPRALGQRTSPGDTRVRPPTNHRASAHHSLTNPARLPRGAPRSAAHSAAPARPSSL